LEAAARVLAVVEAPLLWDIWTLTIFILFYFIFLFFSFLLEDDKEGM